MNKKQIQEQQAQAFNLLQDNKIREARAIYEKIVSIEPNNDSAHHMLSFTCVLNGEYELALKHITTAISLYRCCADYYNTAGSILRDMNCLKEAFLILKEGIHCNPNNPETYNNLALVLNDLGKYEEAKQCFETSLALDPNAAFVHFNYALTLLKTGDFMKGWQEYEWRQRLTSPLPRTLPQLTDLRNRSIVLHHEQGFGDTIQFIRYAKLFKQAGAKVNVSVPFPLERLIKTCPYVDSVNGEVMFADYVIPMMSSPLIFNGEVPLPCLQVKYKPKLTGLNIAICWTSKKQNVKDCIFQEGGRILPSLAALAYKSAQHRLLNHENFEKISTLANLWCVQPDVEIEVPYITKIHTEDFLDTAEFLTQMDLVISIDTSIAHLAGSLNIPTWLILPKNSEWRWGLSDKTNWYPSIKIFRKQDDLFDILYTQLVNFS
jgi:Tfp pilus assembly protein PilF